MVMIGGLPFAGVVATWKNLAMLLLFTTVSMVFWSSVAAPASDDGAVAVEPSRGGQRVSVTGGPQFAHITVRAPG